MITKIKLKEFEEYHGYYDGFYMQKVKKATNITTDVEWNLISNFVQDIKLIKSGLASPEFIRKVDMKLKELCDNDDTIDQLKEIAEKNW